MIPIIIRIRNLLADRRDTALVGYSSLMLLVAIGALALVTELRDGTSAHAGSTIEDPPR